MAPYRTAALARTSEATQPQSGDNGDGGGRATPGQRCGDGGFGALVNGRDWSGARASLAVVLDKVLEALGRIGGGRSTVKVLGFCHSCR